VTDRQTTFPPVAMPGEAAPAVGRTRAQTLFVDADDTLWENNIYFEAVVAQYCRLLERRGVAADLARRTLLDVERRRTRAYGYGIDNFTQGLREACGLLLGDKARKDAGELMELAAAIRRQRLHLVDGAAETLRELVGRHRVILLSKGNRDDQLEKLQRSGLGRYFHQVDVVREKDADTYRSALVRHGARGAEAWMIGNSPRSDILPALEAGLGAVYVPHHATWALELETLPPPETPRYMVVEAFAGLTAIF
jgi:putative hydrolase of the HAD superfamily